MKLHHAAFQAVKFYGLLQGLPERSALDRLGRPDSVAAGQQVQRVDREEKLLSDPCRVLRRILLDIGADAHHVVGGTGCDSDAVTVGHREILRVVDEPCAKLFPHIFPRPRLAAIRLVEPLFDRAPRLAVQIVEILALCLVQCLKGHPDEFVGRGDAGFSHPLLDELLRLVAQQNRQVTLSDESLMAILPPFHGTSHTGNRAAFQRVGEASGIQDILAGFDSTIHGWL